MALADDLEDIKLRAEQARAAGPRPPPPPMVGPRLELARQLSALRKLLFPEQLGVVTDRSPLIAVYGSRGCAKSMSIAARMIEESLTHAKSSCTYAAWTLTTAKQIFWEPCLLFLLDKAGIPYTTEEGCVVRFLNRSTIRLVGIDSNEDFSRKLRGKNFRVFAIDEAQDILQAKVDKIAYTDVGPRMHSDGAIILAGTPTNLRGFFWQVTKDEADEREPGWSVHHWIAKANPHYDWQAKVNAYLKRDPDAYSNPSFRQEYLGEWTVDTELRCCPSFDPRLHVMKAIPKEMLAQPLVHCLGADFGTTDPTAVVVAAMDPRKERFAVVHQHKQANMSSDQVPELLAGLMTRYHVPPGNAVGDSGGGKPYMLTLQQRFGLQMDTDNKLGKAEYIKLLDADFKAGRILIVSADPDTDPLVQELLKLSWDARLKNDRTKPRLEVAPGSDDHLFDALRYVWRRCFSTRSHHADPSAFQWSERLQHDASYRRVTRRRTSFGVGV